MYSRILNEGDEQQDQTFTYDQPAFIDRPSPDSSPPIRPRKLRRIKARVLGKLLKTKESIEDYISARPFDKIYCHLDSPFPVGVIEKFKDETKSLKLYTMKRKLFFTSRKFSLVANVGKAQITIWGNNKSSEIQVNGKEVSYEFIIELLDLVYPGEQARLARLDLSFDVKRSLEYVTQNIVFLNKRSRRLFSKKAPRVSVDPKKGLIFEYTPTTEYHGKNKEIAVYDSGKKHKLGKDVSRVEVRYKTMRVVPVKYFQDLELLKIKKRLFSDIRLPMRIDLKSLSTTEKKHLSKLKRISVIRNCSPSLALSELRHKDRYGADSAARALKKSERDHFDFHEAFKTNLDIFLGSKMNSSERDFLDEIRAALRPPTGSA